MGDGSDTAALPGKSSTYAGGKRALGGFDGRAYYQAALCVFQVENL
jgi:hypothetical protein